MMKNEIKYIGFYDLPGSKHKRVSNLAATNKMDYIAEAINRNGFSVNIISPSWFDDSASKAGFKFKNIITVNEQKKVTLCPSFGTKKKWTRNAKIILSLMWLFVWLVLNTKRNEKIFMYHTPWLSLPVRWAKKIKGFKLILEVEEVYGDVSVVRPYFYKFEQKLFDGGDAFLLSTELLVKRINSGKPFIIIYGAYKIYKRLATPPKDGKIHLLYAGIIDTHKAGAFNALEAARYLPDIYCLHIIGFGKITLLNQKILEINKLNGCQVYYNGSLIGAEYIKYCQQCHIGLSTQKMEGKYLETSFPSKIISYLSMGLQVVSCKIACVSKSKISDHIFYYEEESPQSIARAILNVAINISQRNELLISELDKNFTIQIKSFIIN